MSIKMSFCYLERSLSPGWNFHPGQTVVIFQLIQCNLEFQPGRRRSLFYVHVVIEQRKSSVIMFVMTRDFSAPAKV